MIYINCYNFSGSWPFFNTYSPSYKEPALMHFFLLQSQHHNIHTQFSIFAVTTWVTVLHSITGTGILAVLALGKHNPSRTQCSLKGSVRLRPFLFLSLTTLASLLCGTVFNTWLLLRLLFVMSGNFSGTLSHPAQLTSTQGQVSSAVLCLQPWQTLQELQWADSQQQLSTHTATHSFFPTSGLRSG